METESYIHKETETFSPSEPRKGTQPCQYHDFSPVSCCCSVTKSCPILSDPMDCNPQAPLSSSVSPSLLRFMSIESVMLSNSPILCHPLLLPSIFPSIKWPEYWRFASGAQSIGASASASVLPVNIQGWFPLGLTGLISSQSKGLSRVFSSTTVWKH